VFANIDALAGLDMCFKAPVMLPPADGALDGALGGPPVPDLSQTETTLYESVGIDLSVSINVGGEADLGKSPQGQGKQSVHSPSHALDPFFKAGVAISLFSKSSQSSMCVHESIVNQF
jgi:hypothetical protein